ncbi:MAG: O-antigen ligase family protein [Candidatus Magnetoovum sp. WYHC-5]|nr:O-antigen ligase family protein [Candidatus Magnetoovum sp. WYHC-5]
MDKVAALKEKADVFFGLTVRLGGKYLLLIFILCLSFICAVLPWYISSIIYFLLILGIVSIVKPQWGLYCLILFLPITKNNLYLCIKDDWNFLLIQQYVDLIPLPYIFVFLFFTTLIIIKLSGVKSYKNKKRLVIPLFILLFYAAITLLWSKSLEHSFFNFIVFFINVMLFYLIVSIVGDDKTHKMAMWWFVVSLSIQCLMAVSFYFIDIYKDVLYHIYGNLYFGFSFHGGFFTPDGKIQHAFGLQDHHETALLMNMGIAVAIGLFLTTKKRYQRVVLVLIALLMAAIILRTESRAGIGAFICMMGAQLFFIKRLRSHLFIYGISFIILIILLYGLQYVTNTIVTGKQITPRMLFLGSEMAKSGNFIDPGEVKNKRTTLYKNSFRDLKEYFVEGFGIGNLKYMQKAPHAHSIYFSFIFDFGLVGLVCLLYIILSLVYNFIKMYSYQTTYLQIMVIVLLCGFISTAVHGVVDFEYNTTSLWLFLGLIYATINLSRLEKDKR